MNESIDVDRSRSILIVDDDESVLSAIVRVHRKNYDIHTATSGAEALGMIEAEGPFSVIISDYGMPGMNGATFLSRAEKLLPHATRILLSGQSDLHAAIDSVNRGHVFRFLKKPCEPGVLAAGINLGLEQHRLIEAEKTLLKDTLRGSIQVLTDVLSLVNPSAFGRAARIEVIVSHIAYELEIDDSWMYQAAALLSQIGCVAIPPEIILEAGLGKTLTPDRQSILDSHPDIGCRLLHNIPRLEAVAEMISMQGLSCKDESLHGEECVVTGAKMLKVAIDADQSLEKGANLAETISRMEATGDYEPCQLAALASLEGTDLDEVEIQTLPISRLTSGMFIEQDIFNAVGALVVQKGQEVTTSLLARLQSHLAIGGIPDAARVRNGHLMKTALPRS